MGSANEQHPPTRNRSREQRIDLRLTKTGVAENSATPQRRRKDIKYGSL